MNQSVQIFVTIPVKGNVLKNFIQKAAEEVGVAGMAHATDDETIKIIAHGTPDRIDNFIDLLYAGHGKIKPEMVAVEPYSHSKDFRGLFRIL